MNPKHRACLARTPGILLGLFILFISYRVLHSELSLRKYQKDFLQVGHPRGTVLVDSFGQEADYYPATYVDDSVRFKSVYLVGELRRYTGDWHDIQTFYSDKILEADGLNTLPIIVLPVEIQSDGQKTLLKSVSDFSYSPLGYDILEELQHRYLSKGLPQEETEGKFYFIYVTPDM